jgi:hypothetical protein
MSQGAALPAAESAAPRQPRSPFSRCANPHCGTGWMHLWRSRRLPVFEGQWACSPGCMTELVRWAVSRETAMGMPAPYRHRVPLGLLLVDQGQISRQELSDAILGQQSAGSAEADAPRLGEWLVRSGVLSETVLTRTLSLQWNCPVFAPGAYRAADVATALPRLLAEALGALPLRVLGGRTLCLAFSGRIDRTLSYAAERMLGLRVAPGLVSDSEFRAAQAQFHAAPAPRARLLNASGPAALARLIGSVIEQEKPAEARLARVHGLWWLRLWRRPPGAGLPDCADVEDILCSTDQFSTPSAPVG